MRGARWVSAGLTDQAVIALANAGNTLLAVTFFPLGRGGVLLLSVGLGYLVLTVNRSFVGDVLLALTARYDDPAQRARLVRDGLATAAVIGLAAAALCAALWAAWPSGHSIDFRDLIWLVPFLPMILLHDTGRYSYLAEREPQRALVIDLVWVGTQAAVIGVLYKVGLLTPGLLLASWGLGATAGCLVFLLRSGQRPWRGRVRRWVSTTRHLAGWFTLTAIIGQLQVQAVGWIVTGQLSRVDLALLRTGQTVQLQPVQNFITAVLGLLVPRSSALAGKGERAALNRQTWRTVAAFAALGAVMVAVMVTAVYLAVGWVPKFAGLRGVVLPIALQAAIYLLQVPFTAAMRGMHRARMLLVQYLCFSATSLTGLVIGAVSAGLSGAAWGLTTGAAVGLVVMVLLYQRAVHLVGASVPGSAARTVPGGAERDASGDVVAASES